MKFYAIVAVLLIAIAVTFIVPIRSEPTPTGAAVQFASQDSIPSTATPSFKVNTAKHFEHFCAAFVARLSELPPVSVQHQDVNHDIRKAEAALTEIEKHIRNCEKAYARMRPDERHRKIELKSLPGKMVLATPSEHLANLHATYQACRQLWRQQFGDTPAITLVTKNDSIRWSPQYEMDARKTDSIISPYIGTVIIVGMWYSGDDTEGRTYRYRFRFACRDEQWVLRSIKRASVRSDRSKESWLVVNLAGERGAYFMSLFYSN